MQEHKSQVKRKVASERFLKIELGVKLHKSGDYVMKLN